MTAKKKPSFEEALEKLEQIIGKLESDDLALDEALDDTVAGIMLTVPNTLGLFETEIREVTARVHAAGGLCYFDGANLNAFLGVARPGDMGADVFHFNLHKSLSTPHGGGGPGSGPFPRVSGAGSAAGLFVLPFGRPRFF